MRLSKDLNALMKTNYSIDANVISLVEVGKSTKLSSELKTIKTDTK